MEGSHLWWALGKLHCCTLPSLTLVFQSIRGWRRELLELSLLGECGSQAGFLLFLHHPGSLQAICLLQNTLQIAWCFTRNLIFFLLSKVHLQALGDKYFQSEEFFQISPYPTPGKLVLVMVDVCALQFVKYF